MTYVPRPRPPRSLSLLKERCAKLFLEERTLIASHGPIIITKRGNPHTGEYRLFPIPYDLLPEFSCRYLWEELRIIEWGIEARGYSEMEMLKLEGLLDELEDSLSRITPCYDLANFTIIRQLNLLN